MTKRDQSRAFPLLFLFFWAACLFVPAGVALAGTPWQITADSLTHLKFPESVLAEGNVILSRPEEVEPSSLVLRADWVRYDVERGLVKARGNVYIIAGEEEIMADAANLELESQTGTFSEATVFLTRDHLYIIGKEIEKTGEVTYTVHEGWTSVCDPYNPKKKPPWAIRSSSTDVKIDGMAVMDDARFHVKEMPILYTPWLTFPVKTKRETGFLFPEWSHSSRNGVGMVAPFFVNISPSADVTLYPDYLQRRGMMYGVEARYVAAKKSYATVVFDYLRDRMIDTPGDNYKGDNFVRKDKNRYWFRGKANHDFHKRLIGRLDLDLVSDRDFIQEFRDAGNGFANNDQMFMRYYMRGLGEETALTRSSTAQIVRSWDYMTLSGETAVVQDVSEVISPETPVQTLPRVAFDGRTPLSSSPWSVSWSSEYDNYWRKGGIGGQKLDAHPQLITALPRGTWVEGSVTTGLRESLYYVEVFGQNTDWAYNRVQSRFIPDFGVNTATLLMRDFDLQVEKYQWLEHMVRPSIGYSYIPRVDERQLPPFGDNVKAANVITYGVDNYFELGGTDEEDGEYLNRNLGLFNISQSYSIQEDRRTLRNRLDKQRVLSGVNFDLLVYPLQRLDFRYQTTWDVYGEGISNYNLRTHMSNLRGDSFAIDYRYALHGTYDVMAEGKLKLTDYLAVEGNTTVDLETTRTVRSLFGLLYTPPCWKMELRATREIQEQTLMVVFYLDVIGKAAGWDNDHL